MTASHSTTEEKKGNCDPAERAKEGRWRQREQCVYIQGKKQQQHQDLFLYQQHRLRRIFINRARANQEWSPAERERAARLLVPPQEVARLSSREGEQD